MQSKKFAVILNAVRRLDSLWRNFVDDIEAAESQLQSTTGGPSVEIRERWNTNIRIWCILINELRSGLDNLHERLCKALDDTGD
jgi:hypothetical protein